MPTCTDLYSFTFLSERAIVFRFEYVYSPLAIKRCDTKDELNSVKSFSGVSADKKADNTRAGRAITLCGNAKWVTRRALKCVCVRVVYRGVIGVRWACAWRVRGGSVAQSVLAISGKKKPPGRKKKTKAKPIGAPQ